MTGSDSLQSALKVLRTGQNRPIYEVSPQEFYGLAAVNPTIELLRVALASGRASSLARV